MVYTCSAVGCTNKGKKNSGIKFHRYPTDGARRKRWMQAITRMSLDDPSKTWEPKEHDRICSQHFIGGHPSDDPEHPGYITSIFSFTPLSKATKDDQRYEGRVMHKQSLLLVLEEVDENRHFEAADVLLELACSMSTVDKGTDPRPDATQAELDALTEKYTALESRHKGLQSEYQRLLCENTRLQEEINANKFSFFNLKNNQIRNLTAIPSHSMYIYGC